jgi:lysine 6-dehydrogenase
MFRVAVLGAGLVGRPMAWDLAADGRFAVTAVDRDEAALARVAERPGVETLNADLADPAAVARAVAGCDLVLGAVPGSLGFRTLRAVIECGLPVVDISFFTEDPFALDARARELGVTAVMDCGVFPGMGSALIGRVQRKLDELEEVVVYVGGLPEVRRWPWEYRAVFSPDDVIEEYTRPARLRQGGRDVVRPALSEVELVDLPEVGTLEAFNTDGLRTLLTTVAAPEMREKTLRYPGHAERMAMLAAGGFFSDEPVEVDGVAVAPRSVTARLLFPPRPFAAGDGDLTVMRIAVTGSRSGQRLRYVYDLLDRYDPDLDVTSMARTTGYTATMTLRLLAEGRFRRPGICPPEYLGQAPGCVDHLLAGLAERGVVYRETVEVL